MVWRFNLVNYFRPQASSKLKCGVWKFDHLVRAMLPQLHQFFEEYSISCEYYGMSWLLTLFSTDLPLESHVYRIWDYFLVYGDRILFQVGLALLYRVQNKILNLNQTYLS